MRSLNRRTLIAGGCGVAAVAATAAIVRTATADDDRHRSPDDPFTLGVASGDPTPDGVVLWTRLALDPVAEDGHGGMPSRAIGVEWQVSGDDRFKQVEASGSASAVPELGHSVHVEVQGLRPGRRYYYRFRSRTTPTVYHSPTGTFLTAPEPTTLGNLSFAVASCAHYQHGYFHAYQAMAEDRPDLVIFLGDYIYENHSSPDDRLGLVRLYQPQGANATTLADYRRRYGQHHADMQLQAAHAAAAWVTVFDDHEVHNQWDRLDVPSERTVAAFQAWYENVPVRLAQKPRGSTLQLYRRLRWGNLATFHMLDTRQYRDPVTQDCAVMAAPTRTLIGAEQERWLVDGFTDRGPRWDLLGQQVFFSQRSVNQACGVADDKWDGYPEQRDRIVRAWTEAKVRNPVVLTGDVHHHFAADVSTDFGVDDPLGAELVCSSITSRGRQTQATLPALSANPNLKYGADKRGYVLGRLTPDRLTAEFKVVSDVHSEPWADQTISTDATFVVEDRKPGLQTA